MKVKHSLLVIGWREYIALPELGIGEIKVKIDTGARSSALHAFEIELFRCRGKDMVRFKVHPYQRNPHYTIATEAQLLDQRQVRNSGGHTQLRPVIETSVEIGEFCWPIELTLTNRDVMGFRMLLGRQAVKNRFLVHPGKSFLFGHPGAVH